MAKKPRLLVVEDEREMSELFREILEPDFEVAYLESGLSFIPAIRTHRPAVILLDQMLPGKSGRECLRELRYSTEFSRTPVIMVTGISGDDDKVTALDAGADDYVTKPFLPAELIARIHALIRRTKIANGEDVLDLENQDQLVCGPLQVDLKGHRVYLSGEEVALTLTEFNILKALLCSRGEVLSRERLRQTALGNLNVSDRTIDVHVAALRKKLRSFCDQIETVRGVGYRLGT